MTAVIFPGKINALIQSVISWSRRSSNAHEELSCSYQPSRRNREDIVHNYLKSREFPSIISDDVTDNDSSNAIHASQYIDNNSNYDDDDDDDIANLVDAHELRRRLPKMDTLQSRRYVKSLKEPLQFVE